MLRIERITLREISLPLKEPFRISSGVMSTRRILILEVEDADGTVGWSECVAAEEPNYSPDTIDTSWHALRTWLGPRVLGREFATPSALDAAMQVGVSGHRMAKAALEMGAWDVAARQAGVSLSEQLGGTRERIDVGISLGIQPTPEKLVEKAQAAVAQGYQRVKLKIAPGFDVPFVAAVREAVGPEQTLSVDANAAYFPKDADHLAQLDAFDLIMIEQPLDREDLVRHAALQRRLKTSLCLDESITGSDRAEDAVELGSARIINIKPGRVGGFTSSKAIHDIAQSAGWPVWCGGMLESGIGRAHNVALASLPNFKLAGDLSPSARYWERDIVTPEWTMDEGGHVDVPRGKPGIGVEVDRDRVADLTEREEVLRA